MADYKGREGVAGSVRSKSEHGFRRGLGGLSLSASFSKSRKRWPREESCLGLALRDGLSGLRKVPETCCGGSQALGTGALLSRKR